ncbi:MAG TPA: hypothetical protein VF258_09570, partial [Luteolibacter sp.]
GTSSDFHDNWCLGFTPEFTVGVWAGNFEQQPMKGLSGIAGAGPIFHRAMLRLHQNAKPTWFKRPAGLTEISIDPRSGKLLPATDKNARPDLAAADYLPAHATPADYDTSGKVLLDHTYSEWFSSRHNHRLNELVLSPAPYAQEPFRIISPADNATFLLDPEIPSGSGKLRPVTNFPGTAQWTSDTLRIDPASPEPIIHLTIGTHLLTATHPATGATHTLTLRVKSH